MRKTLRALFLGSALGLAATAVTAQEKITPNTPLPPNEAQEELYGVIQDFRSRESAEKEPLVAALEKLEDDYAAGLIPDDQYKQARADALTALYPELGVNMNGYVIAFESYANEITGCTKDNFSVSIPLTAAVNSGDLVKMFDHMVTQPQSSDAMHFVHALSDAANFLRQRADFSESTLIARFKFDELTTPAHTAQVDAALAEISRISMRNIKINAAGDVLRASLRAGRVQDLDVFCTPRPSAPSATPDTARGPR